MKYRNARLNPFFAKTAMSILVTATSVAAMPAVANESNSGGRVSALLEEVVVTARKREEGMQDVPLAVTAYGSDQLDALKVRDLTNLAVGMPNVALDDVGTNRGTANFSIRGVGINSSIPGIDPTVGVFVNGVYLGLNWGVVFDMFDVESVEVLRGPQGTLFGRNVTGGAVLLNTKKPGEELEVSLRTAVDTGDEGGINTYYMGAVGGPINENLGGRLVVYLNDDEGKWENDFTGDDHGEIEQLMVRGTLTWAPTDTAELTLRYEYNDTDGDGPAIQSHTNGFGVPGSPVNNERGTFDFSIDETGFMKTETNFISAQLDWDVALGDGTVTSILAHREFESEASIDADGQPADYLVFPTWVESEQVSFELRYNGLFAEKFNVTAGMFYFDNDVLYHERRIGFGGAITADGGGDLRVKSYTLFSQVDYDLTDKWTLTAGVNFSHEDKEVDIAKLSQNVNMSCNIILRDPACPFDFVDNKDWSNVGPKLGATYHLDDGSQLYAHWTRGFRSGGYNLRNVSFDPADVPGPFDEEEVNNYEIGYKSTHDWGRLNAAVFYNQIDDMQRELLLPGPIGTVQLVRNTADTNIFGVEIDGTFSITNNLLLMASVGYIDAEYDLIREDISNDGVIDEIDLALELPRAAEWTYSLGLNHELDLGDWGYMSSRINWAYRDAYKLTDDNRGFNDEVDMVDAGVDFYSNDGRWVFSIYGRNLADEVIYGADAQYPATFGPVPLGGTFSPLGAGRRYGVEVTFNL